MSEWWDAKSAARHRAAVEARRQARRDQRAKKRRLRAERKGRSNG